MVSSIDRGLRRPAIANDARAAAGPQRRAVGAVERAAAHSAERAGRDLPRADAPAREQSAVAADGCRHDPRCGGQPQLPADGAALLLGRRPAAARQGEPDDGRLLRPLPPDGGVRRRRPHHAQRQPRAHLLPQVGDGAARRRPVHERDHGQTLPADPPSTVAASAAGTATSTGPARACAAGAEPAGPAAAPLERPVPRGAAAVRQRRGRQVRAQRGQQRRRGCLASTVSTAIPFPAGRDHHRRPRGLPQRRRSPRHRRQRRRRERLVRRIDVQAAPRGQLRALGRDGRPPRPHRRWQRQRQPRGGEAALRGGPVGWRGAGRTNVPRRRLRRKLRRRRRGRPLPARCARGALWPRPSLLQRVGAVLGWRRDQDRARLPHVRDHDGRRQRQRSKRGRPVRADGSDRPRDVGAGQRPVQVRARGRHPSQQKRPQNLRWESADLPIGRQAAARRDRPRCGCCSC